MLDLNDQAFFHGWKRSAIITIGILEVIVVIMFVLTELGNVASNFWLTNVFAGSWCGLVLLIHALTLFVIGCCLRGPTAAFRVVIITIIALLACALLISFNAVFIARPSTCILTSSCSSNSNSTTLFSYSMSQNFFTVFNGLGSFRNYTLSQSKFLFQTVQISVGCLGFVLCLIYLVIYFITKKQTSTRVLVLGNEPNDRATLHAIVQQQPINTRRKKVPQVPPGEVPWNDKEKK